MCQVNLNTNFSSANFKLFFECRKRGKEREREAFWVHVHSGWQTDLKSVTCVRVQWLLWYINEHTTTAKTTSIATKTWQNERAGEKNAFKQLLWGRSKTISFQKNSIIPEISAPIFCTNYFNLPTYLQPRITNCGYEWRKTNSHYTQAHTKREREREEEKNNTRTHTQIAGQVSILLLRSPLFQLFVIFTRETLSISLIFFNSFRTRAFAFSCTSCSSVPFACYISTVVRYQIKSKASIKVKACFAFGGRSKKSYANLQPFPFVRACLFHTYRFYIRFCSHFSLNLSIFVHFEQMFDSKQTKKNGWSSCDSSSLASLRITICTLFSSLFYMCDYISKRVFSQHFLFKSAPDSAIIARSLSFDVSTKILFSTIRVLWGKIYLPFYGQTSSHNIMKCFHIS